MLEAAKLIKSYLMRQPNNMRGSLNKKGFTLVELMVSISIISILSAVTIASLQTAKKRANDMAATQAVLQFKKAMSSYKVVKGSYPDEFSSSAVGVSASGIDAYLTSAGVIPNYIRSSPAKISPSALLINPYNANINGWSTPGSSTYTTCGGKPSNQGYMLILYGFPSNVTPDLPLYSFNGSPVPTYYCITGDDSVINNDGLFVIE